MPQADSQNTTSASIATKVANGLFELESPILRIRNLAYAARLMATSPEIGDADVRHRGPLWDVKAALADGAVLAVVPLISESGKAG
jgi:hypothetical protein